MKEKEKQMTYSFKVSPSLLLEVRKKIDKENAKAKELKDRSNLSKKMTELLSNYVGNK